MAKGPIKYKLQIQVHEVSPDDSHLVLHAARAWDRKTHPWINVADVTITTVLHANVTQRSWGKAISVNSLLQLLPEPSTIQDFSFPGYAQRRLLPFAVSGLLEIAKSETEPHPQTRKYWVHVETGKRHGAGTDANIFITITGN